ncbi:ClpX C4-type zinc finger protein [Caldibacillus lycopersici]|uniref:ClpX C4-type zinc finger protein n=1 Tax=Perspicuibacillus lycopersici TaxID=1325689 RepID=A0AAE3IW75_9BACI|nr:ClpX C4-type zinc finger protein [Perspicuibacillus lycopersici]MCU9614524.1 ClpX C4-type zinc finger protein [Perspicuibacillus lycopersici]
MEQEFRKKTFRGAKIEDIILELEKLSELCEEKSKGSDHLERQRFYEGMAIAYTTIAVKLKGDFDYIEPEVIDELYNALEKTSNPNSMNNTAHGATCSFCHKSKEEVGELAIGPGAAICKGCLEFGLEVIKLNSTDV